MGTPQRAARRHRRGAVGSAFAGCALVPASAALAAQTPTGGSPVPYAAERLMFEAADSDGDGRVSEAEMTRDAAAAFSTLDRNRDRRLSRAELGEHDAKLFERVDADTDGMLTFQEVMRHKIKGFEAADTNRDGALGFEEMIAGATKELEGSR